MEEKSRVLLKFTPQIGLGKILFSCNKEEDILERLGGIVERNIDFFDKNEYVIHLDYLDLAISVNLYFESGIFDRLSIHTQDVILDDFQFSHHIKNEILLFIAEYHNRHKLLFDIKVEIIEDVRETCYIYDTVGLTIWFDEKQRISDICVEKQK